MYNIVMLLYVSLYLFMSSSLVSINLHLEIKVFYLVKEINTMKKTILAILVSAMSVMFAVGCAGNDSNVETPVNTPAETGVETPVAGEDTVEVKSLLESRDLSADEQASLEKVVKFMRVVEDTVQVGLFEMKEIDGGFNMELVLKNNFDVATTVKEGTIIVITNQKDEEIEVAVPMDIEIAPNAGVLFETEVKTDLLTKRADVLFIEFKAEEE